MTSGEAYDSLPAYSLCQCRQQCFVDPRCRALSYHPGLGLCYRSSQPTPNINLTGAVYEYEVHSLVPGLDGLFYVMMDVGMMSRDHCVQMCSNMTGFHLPIAKTRDSRIYFSNSQVFIGLSKKNASEDPMWDDGTKLDRKTLELSNEEPVLNNVADCGYSARGSPLTVFGLYLGKIDDECNLSRCVCQAKFGPDNN
ncbi:uncharacterized protein LOC108670901 [Hyalella azteca]|uniref:Uncharacterized protein LOC108670901 n=1 Tax=Hyalella azteca TaxID=294128 RepID=A0A8B7NJQ0_HYAAZ|nr:uncharacterized protein LOC108670901 [Hyalella azteca]